MTVDQVPAAAIAMEWKCTHCGAHGTVDLSPALIVWLEALGAEHLKQSPACGRGVTQIQFSRAAA